MEGELQDVIRNTWMYPVNPGIPIEVQSANNAKNAK